MRTTSIRTNVQSSIKVVKKNQKNYIIQIQCNSKLADKTVEFFKKQTKPKTSKTQSAKQLNKGSAVYGSDILDYNKTVTKGFELIKEGKGLENFGMFIICGVNMALRVGNLRKITYGDLQSYSFNIQETKTGKIRKVSVNNIVRQALEMMPKYPFFSPSTPVFLSKKKLIYSPQRLNVLVKEHLHEEGKLITTHSLRKTFARKYYDINKDNPKVIEDLAVLLNHSSTATTRRYIGITRDEINQIYHQVGDSFNT